MGRELILVIDDEEDILELIDYTLSREGYKVLTADSGEKGLKQLDNDSPDLLVLDLMLPGIDGFDLTKKLRAKKRFQYLPIIMLTAKGDEPDIVTGLELGADDYVVKPFSPRVLVARIKSLLRRKQDSQNEKAGIPDEIVRGGLKIHYGRHEVTTGKTTVSLTHSEFEILKTLAQKPGWVFTRSQIVDAIHGESYPVTERSVDVQIVGLRKKLGDYGRAIETVRGVGYRFKE